MTYHWKSAAAVLLAALVVSGFASGVAAQSRTITTPSAADLTAQVQLAVNAPVAAPGGAAIQGGIAVTDHIAAGNGNTALPSGSTMPPMVSNGIVADAR
jgi:ABC-type molybdate transport system substrate-binding protein